jgi:predicted GH43/DUF377 family glycosyl hydrolase
MHDTKLHGLATFALKNGGSIHPITLPPELTGETGIMNPSIFVRNGKIMMNIRHVNYAMYHSEARKFVHQFGPLHYIHPENDVTLTTHNIMCELDSDLNLVDAGKINMKLDTGKPTWNFIGLEDGRLFEWDSRLFICGVRRDCYDDKGTGRMEMCEIEHIDGEWTEIGRYPIPVPDGASSYCEKNWMPVLDMPWHFVKWTNPTQVVKYDITKGTCTTAVLDPNRTYSFPRDIRGGSQVVRINDEQRIALTHEVDLHKDTFGRKNGNYMHRFIVWDNDWNIVHKTDDFFFMGAQRDKTTGLQYTIEFGTGVAFYGDDILISYGLQDNACFVLRMPTKLFYEFLRGE